MSILIKSIQDIVNRSEALRQALKETAYSPEAVKVLKKRFNITEASELVGRSTVAIRQAEERGTLPAPETDQRNNRRSYTIQQLHHMQQVFATSPMRNVTEDKIKIIAVQNFKGGVGKSTVSVHLAQYLARAGYRTLLIDCDSQASTTSLFGFSPDKDIDDDLTLMPYLAGEQRNFRYAIRDTYWNRLKIIPANLQLYGAEYLLASRTRSDEYARKFYHWIRDGIEDISNDFDVVVIDPPPALGMISLNVLYAANSVVIPMPPGILDFYSTMQFFNMIQEVVDSINETLEYNFIKILVSRKKQRTSDSSTQDDISTLAHDFYGNFMLKNMLYESAEIERAALQGYTLYELQGPTAGRRTYKRAIQNMDEVCSEIETLIRQNWPSVIRHAN